MLLFCFAVIRSINNTIAYEPTFYQLSLLVYKIWKKREYFDPKHNFYCSGYHFATKWINRIFFYCFISCFLLRIGNGEISWEFILFYLFFSFAMTIYFASRYWNLYRKLMARVLFCFFLLICFFFTLMLERTTEYTFYIQVEWIGNAI